MGGQSNLRYKGGEFIGVNYKLLPDIISTFKRLWDYNYRLYENKEVKLNEEAHFLSLIYHDLGYDDFTANKYMRRIWTALKFDTVVDNDKDLYMWHLPAEKMYGFIDMFNYLQSNHTKEEYLKKLSKVIGIPGPRYKRYIKRAIVRTINKLGLR